MEKREDVRIVKSKRDLCNALSELMRTTPFRKITVGDICDKAMINKMTFYKHYADKYELLNDVLLNTKKSIVERMNEADRTPQAEDAELDMVFRLLDAVIDECLKQKELLTGETRDDMVLTMISTVIEKSVHELLEALDRRRPFAYRLDMLSAAVTGAATFLVKNWLIHEQDVGKQRFGDGIKKFLRDLFESKILFAE